MKDVFISICRNKSAFLDIWNAYAANKSTASFFVCLFLFQSNTSETLVVTSFFLKCFDGNFVKVNDGFSVAKSLETWPPGGDVERRGTGCHSDWRWKQTATRGLKDAEKYWNAPLLWSLGVPIELQLFVFLLSQLFHCCDSHFFAIVQLGTWMCHKISHQI